MEQPEGGSRVATLSEHNCGWKLNKTAAILTQEYMVRIESAASYGSSAAAN